MSLTVISSKIRHNERHISIAVEPGDGTQDFRDLIIQADGTVLRFDEVADHYTRTGRTTLTDAEREAIERWDGLREYDARTAAELRAAERGE